MASGNIKGITIEIGGDTTGLGNALKDVNKQSKDLQGELKAVERGLKFDPGNVELVRQKQELLTASIQSTSEKLDVLKTAQSQVEAQFERGDIGVEQYRTFQRELQSTENELNQLQGQLNSLSAEQDRLAQTTRQLGTFFDATNTDVEQFASTLGTRLTQSIRDGSASADQMERALRLMGRQALGAGTDIDQMRESLRQADNGSSLDEIRADLNRISQSADEAEESIKGFGNELSTVVGGLAAGGGIAGVVSSALDTSSLKTMIDISFNVPEESKQSIFEAVKSIGIYGVEGEEALEGIRRQWALNKDASDEVNSNLVEGAAIVAKAYAGIDFIELVQETNEIASALEITNDEALALTNSLLKAGFPPEQLDTIAEYGMQMKNAGFNAAEIQHIFSKGIETKTWNIDNLNDGVKEARITMSEFGLEIDKSTKGLLKGAGMSTTQFQAWGKAVSDGGAEGSKSMSEMVTWLDSIEDSTLKNELGIKAFGTKWEDQGQNLISVFQGIEEAQDKTVENQNELNGAIDRMNQDPLVKIKDAFKDTMANLQPLLLMIAEFIAKIAEWVSNNTGLAAMLAVISVALGVLLGAFAVLMPAIGALVGLWPALIGVIAGISSPILIAVGAIIGLGAAFIALWQNSETFRDNLTSVFEVIKGVVVAVFEAIASFVGEKISAIKQFWDTDGAQILAAAENIFNGIMAVVKTVMPAIRLVIDIVWTAIKQVITGALDIIMGAVKVFSGLFTGDFSKMWEGVKQIFSGAFNVIIGWLSLSFLGGIRTLLANLGKTGLSLMKGMWDDILGVFKSMGGSIRSFTDDTLNKVLGFFRGFTTSVKTQMGNAKQGVIDVWNQSMAFLKNIDLKQIGKDIIQGLINGIGSMATLVTDKVKDLANSIPEWAKKILGIHSPSRVMMQIGLWTGEGMAIGLDNSSKKVNGAMSNIGDGILAVSNWYQKEHMNLLDEYNKKNEDKNQKTLEKIYKIQDAAAKKKRKLTKQELQQIALLEVQYKDSKLKSEIDFQKKYKSLVEKSEKEYLEVIEKYIADKKSLEELSLIEEVRIWQESISLFKEGTDERIKAQQQYQASLSAINDQIVSINREYQTKMQTINNDLIAREEELNKAYGDAFNKRYDTLMSFAGLFDEFIVKNEISGSKLLSNLQGQVDGFKKWQETFSSLSKREVDANLLEELSQLGINVLPELLALNSLTDEQLTRYSELYREKSELARLQTEKELKTMKDNTGFQIDQLRTLANEKLTQLEKEWTISIQAVTEATKNEFASMGEIGKNAGQGLLNGLASMQGPLISKAQEIANAISSAIQTALDIRSPSRVMKGFGINIGQGLIVGMDDMISKVTQSSARLSGAVQSAQASLSNCAAKSMDSSGSVSNSNSTITNAPVSNVYHVTLDAKNVREFNDIVQLMQGIPQASRAT